MKLTFGVKNILGVGIDEMLRHCSENRETMQLMGTFRKRLSEIKEAIEFYEESGLDPADYQWRLEVLEGKRAADDPDRPAA